MGISRRRLLVVAAALPLARALPVEASAVREWVRGGIERDAIGSVRSVFGLDPGVAGEVLLRATKPDALPDGYAPTDLVNASVDGIPSVGNQLLRALVVGNTRDLIREAGADGHHLYVGSGYRSQAYQVDVFAAQLARWGDDEQANRYSARPGHSQHQLGTTIDFTSEFRAFRGGSSAAWLSDNAHRFGFVLPYTVAAVELTGYVDEPWHARWLGSLLAAQLQSANYQHWAALTVDDVVALVRLEAGLDA
jgi:LAS superfamily LD-carboxypeptidase LdcB